MNKRQRQEINRVIRTIKSTIDRSATRFDSVNIEPVEGGGLVATISTDDVQGMIGTCLTVVFSLGVRGGFTLYRAADIFGNDYSFAFQK